MHQISLEYPQKVTQPNSQFLDFPRYPQWSQGFIKSIEPQTPKPSTEIQPGDKLNVRLEGMAFSPVVLVRLTLLAAHGRYSSPNPCPESHLS